jgi:hypothetical protein
MIFEAMDRDALVVAPIGIHKGIRSLSVFQVNKDLNPTGC